MVDTRPRVSKYSDLKPVFNLGDALTRKAEEKKT